MNQGRYEFCPWNEDVYVLEGGEGHASCRTSSAPDLVLSASELAEAYLGAVGFTTLARGGRIGVGGRNVPYRTGALGAV